MTEPKQSFTEEVREEALKHGADFEHGDKADIAAQSFHAGAQAALSILSRGLDEVEIYEAFVDADGGVKNSYDFSDDRAVELVEHSALVAERARNAALQAEIEQQKEFIKGQLKRNADSVAKWMSLESENAALKQKLETFEYSGESKSMEIRQLRAQLARAREMFVENFQMAEFYKYNELDFDLELQKKGQGDE